MRSRAVAASVFLVLLLSLGVFGCGGGGSAAKAAEEAAPIPPIAAFSGSPTAGVTPFSVLFTNESSTLADPRVAYLWRFGDGAISNDTHPVHIYTEPGLYTVSLVVFTTAGSDTELKADFVLVQGPPVADFSASTRTGQVPLTVAITNSSSLGGFSSATYLWNFGDGQTSVEENPVHTYTAIGAFTVSLTVTTAGGSDTISKVDLIDVLPLPPVADFTASPTSGVTPLGVQFTSASDLMGASSVSYSWNFGDGQTSTSENPMHTYTDSGTFSVLLTVTTAGGTDSVTKIGFIVVLPPPPPPVANFTGSATSGVTPLGVQFTNSSNLNGASSASYFWNFGDGQTSTAENPLHTYTGVGTFTVSLTVTTAGGSDTTTKVDFVDVLPLPPLADFNVSPSGCGLPLAIQFTDTSDLMGALSVSYFWEFGDGQTSAEQDPLHMYAGVGIFTVSLTVTTPGGTATAAKSVPLLAAAREYIVVFEEGIDLADTRRLFLHISGETSTMGDITIPGLVFSAPFSVVPGTVTEIEIPVEAMVRGSDVITEQGIIIVANDPIMVYGLNLLQFGTDGFAAFSVSALCTEYYVMSIPSFTIRGESQFAVVAAEDNTTVTITPTATTASRVAGESYQVLLNRAEVYQLRADDFLEDFTGTHILSDKPIAVFAGDLCALIPPPPPSAGACDHIVEQMPPVNTWGTEVITVPLETRLGGDTFRILAAEDSTLVTIEGGSPESFALNKGEFAQRILEGVNRIVADKPILVAQFSNGMTFDDVLGDPFMMMVMPAERFLDNYTFATPSTGFDLNFVNVVARTVDAAGGQVLLDGTPLSPGVFTEVPGTTFSTAQVAVSVGSHTVSAPNPVGLYIYGFAFFDSYGFPGGMAI